MIFRQGLSVRGLNTAATLWCSEAVGSLAGSGLYLPATTAAGLVLLSNTLLRPIARRLDRDASAATEVEVEYTVVATCGEADELHVRNLPLQAAMREALVLKSIRSVTLPEGTNGPAMARVQAVVIAEGRNDHAIEQVVGRLSLEPSVTEALWQVADSHADD